ncbi:MAG: hypothetical protein LAP87_20875 [Acidobacteriia bacterium]|nr:hypothetical protein [Terriglobia bacterium]
MNAIRRVGKFLLRLGQFLADLWRHRKSPEYTEIWHHAGIGGAIAEALALFDMARTEWVPAWLRGHPGLWTPLLTVLVFAAAFALAFALIHAFEVWRKRSHPSPLPRLGRPPDGHWVYAIREVDGVGFHLGAVAGIRSSGWGFQMSATSYLRHELEAEERRNAGSLAGAEPMGSYHGEGYLWRETNEDRIHYSYQGRDREGPDFGVGYSTFGEESSRLTVEGRFAGLAPGDKPTARFLKGRRVADVGPERERFQLDDGRTLLLEYLRAVSADPGLLYRFPKVGAIDGHWVDAIYQEQCKVGFGVCVEKQVSC